MPKYINVDEIPSLFNEEYKRTMNLIKQGETHLDNLAEGFLEAKQVIDRMPSADVRENVSAHYIAEYDGYADGNPVYDMWYCSNCDYYFEEYDDKPPYKYCPNCGAKLGR